MLQQAVRGPGAVDADEELGLQGAGDLLQTGRQHAQVVLDGVRPGIPAAQLHCQALTGVRAPAGQRVEAERALERRRCPFLLRSGSDDRGVQVHDDPALQVPSGNGEIGEAARPQMQQAAHLAAHPPPHLRDLSQRVFVEAGQHPAHRRVRHSRAEELLVVQVELLGLQQTPCSEHDRHSQLDQHPAPLPPPGRRTRRQHPGQSTRQPQAVGQFPQQHRPRMPYQLLPVSSHGQPTVPPCTLDHQKGALLSAADTT